MEIQCLFEDYTFNTGETFYKCIINYPSYLSEDDLTYFGTHKPGRSNNDVTFLEIRYNNIRKDLLKSFPNIKILSVQVSNFKTISKDDLIEFKNIERFICEYCELEYLPRDLFEGFNNLKYIKMIRNKLTIIEPNILDGLDKLEYVNFKSNPNYSKFYSKNPIYVSDSTLEELKNHLFEVFLTFDKNVIEKYIESYPDKMEILRIFRERSNDVNSNLKMHELTFSYYDEKRIQEYDEHKQFNTQLEQKIMKLEQINLKLNEKIKNFKELEAKSKQQIEELMNEISNEKNDKKRLKRDLQKQIDVLAQQLQSVLLINFNK